MSAIEANPRVFGDISVSLGTTAFATVGLSNVSVRVSNATSELLLFSKVTIILPESGATASKKDKQ